MATDVNGEEVELKNLGNEIDQTTDDLGDQETSLLEDQHTDGDIHDLGGEPPDGIQIGGAWDTNPSSAPEDESVTDFRERMAPIRAMDIVERVWGFRPRESYGESSKKLIKSLKIRWSDTDFRKTVGAKFGWKDVIVWESKTPESTTKPGGVPVSRFRLSKNKKFKKEVDELEVLKDKAKGGWPRESLRAELNRRVDPDVLVPDSSGSGVLADPEYSPPGGGGQVLMMDEVESEIAENLADRLADEISVDLTSLSDMSEILSIPDSDVREIVRAIAGPAVLDIPANDLREVMGALDLAILRQPVQTVAERLAVLDIDITHWEKMEEDEENPQRKKFYGSVARVERLTKDYIRVRNGMKPESDEALGILDEEITASDELRLSRFRRWAKENLLGISAVAISAAGLITGVVMAAKGALKVGAKGLGKFAGAVARVFKKLSPFFAAVGSLISTALSWGARGILWLANNLWLLVVVVVAALYSEYGRRRALKQ